MEPKRRRWILPVVLGAIAAVVGIPGYFVWWALTAEPAVAVDYLDEIDALRARNWPQPPGAEDAWPLLVEACGLITRVDREMMLAEGATLHPEADFRFMYDVRISESERGRLWDREAARTPMIERDAPDYSLLHREPDQQDPPGAVESAQEGYRRLDEAGLFELLGRIAACSDGRRPRQDRFFINWLLPELAPTRTMARVAVGRLHDARERGDNGLLADTVEANMALARHLSRQGTVIDRLSGCAIAGLMLDQLRASFAARAPTAAECRGVLAAFDRQLDVAPLAFPIECERLIAHDVIQRIYTDDGDGDGRLLVGLAEAVGEGPAQVTVRDRLRNLGTLRFASRAEAVSMVDELYNEAIRLASTPWHELAPGDLEAFARARDETDPGRFHVIAALTPSIDRAVAANVHFEMRVAGTRAMIAVELHRAVNGSYPAALAEIEAAPVPDNPITGEPFEYERLDDGRYVLRSPENLETGGAFVLNAVTP